ncbi:MAG: FAD-dependent oxidoreductase, partial [Candidatus Bathyarchaeia archaeon]
MQSNHSLTAIDEISSRIGKDKVFTDKATRLCHRFTHGPEAILHSDLNDFLPDAVVRPTCTEEVQEIVRVADKYEVPLVPQGGLTGSYGAEGMRGTIAVDMTCMDKIIEFDERNHWITAEAGVRIQQIVDFLDEKGYLYYDNPTLAAISTLGSRVAINGYTVYENRWGSSQHVILGIEAVLPNGDVVQLGRGSSK